MIWIDPRPRWSALLGMAMYLQNKFMIASVYEAGTVPELQAPGGFVQLSSFDMLLKSYLTMSLLSLHMAYRSYRFPRQAILLQAGYPIARFHGDNLAVLPDDTHQHHRKHLLQTPRIIQVND